MINIKISFKDTLYLNGLRCCGNMDPSKGEQIISNNRLRTFEKERIIEKVTYQDNHISKERSQYSYRLTPRGKQFCEDLGMKHFAPNRGIERHNCELFKQYTQLSNTEKLTVMNELDIKESILQKMDTLIRDQADEELDKLMEQTREMSLVDMAYTRESDGAYISVEIVTSNYSQATIEAKQLCSEVIHCQEIQIINIH